MNANKPHPWASTPAEAEGSPEGQPRFAGRLDPGMRQMGGWRVFNTRLTGNTLAFHWQKDAPTGGVMHVSATVQGVAVHQRTPIPPADFWVLAAAQRVNRALVTRIVEPFELAHAVDATGLAWGEHQVRLAEEAAPPAVVRSCMTPGCGEPVRPPLSFCRPCAMEGTNQEAAEPSGQQATP